MNIKDKILPSTIILKHHVNRYTFLGLAISVGSILIASLIVSYQLTGHVNLEGFVAAQMSNPAIWVLNLTPFMFVYWGQAFCEGLVTRAQSILSDKTNEFLTISNELESKLKFETHHDALTKLANGRMLSAQISHIIEQMGTEGELGLVTIKINDFQNIQSNFGTFNANSLLKQFADKLKSILVDPYLLKVSTGVTSVAHLNNEEFALLLTRLKKDFNAEEFLSTLHQLITSSFHIDDIKINVNTTCGMAIYPVHGDEEGMLLNHANIALEHAKKQGIPYLLYHYEMIEDFTNNRMLIHELMRGIENNELDVCFQPIVALATGKIIGAESMVRFDHPQFGLLNAEKFLPIIEGTTLTTELTAFMLKMVIKQLASWHSAGYPIFASVNISNQDATNRELPAFIEKLLHDYEMAPEFLKLELTEKACLTNQSITREVLEQLSNMGVKLSISDYCSGYSPFIYLLNFPIDDIKIEKSYVLTMTKDAKNAKIVKVIIKLMDLLERDVIANGISDKETLEQLKKSGCAYGQGVYFSRAVDAAQFTNLLGKKSTD
ncbi:putative bifunctional diguanylate cyclase/phosphodiesterase [Legionella maioricensis]|uniref:EAL domain-containing protein n=1 Tax=Legionella maioricensis TaxID=2896528 RepID=A0A9X2ICK4_9GAMM|nr:GGDEF domain-containing phosphodiesterase [Legionella maioricensis]MCL9684532.1 EAL domain-containing protein [Legionella maioricensis]MCL9687874.1 EAL domain-containing protein [Legionella maioricensis]